MEKCITYPTSELIKIAEKNDVRFSFFVDSGFILKLNEYRQKFPQLNKDYDDVTNQVKYLADTGHDVQLHIHPHWEDSFYDGTKWVMVVKRYKLADFNEDDIADIVYRYKKVLTDITGKPVFAFRAGGWCMQPFDKLREAFIQNGITLDSSVFKNGFFSSAQYEYDFRNAPDKDIYRFEHEPTEEDIQGSFTELPISGIRNSPLFFWRLFFLGRKDPYNHKPLGDGRAMAAPGYRKKLLTQFTDNPVSVDGYNAHLLQMCLKISAKKKQTHMVIIGHPKALSRYSIRKIEEFVARNKAEHNFTTYSKIFGTVK